MRVVPTDVGDVIAFAATHIPAWQDEPERVGLSKEQVEAYNELMKMAREKWGFALAARQASVAATATMKAEAKKLRAMSGHLVAQIKAFAAAGGSTEGEGTQSEGEILGRARIDMPGAGGAGRAAGGVPGRPVNVAVNVEATGGVNLSWTAKDAAASSGAWFEVHRRAGDEAAWTLVATVPGIERSRRRAAWTDAAGTTTSGGGAGGAAPVQYTITTRRGAKASAASETVTVLRGMVGSVATWRAAA